MSGDDESEEDDEEEEEAQPSMFDRMWDAKDPTPVEGFVEAAYRAGHNEKFYQAQLWSLLHRRSREGIAKYMRLGYTISKQTPRSVQKYYKFMRQKFPAAHFTDKELRKVLTTKLIKNKNRTARASNEEVEANLADLVTLGGVTEEEHKEGKEPEEKRDGPDDVKTTAKVKPVIPKPPKSKSKPPKSKPKSKPKPKPKPKTKTKTNEDEEAEDVEEEVVNLTEEGVKEEDEVVENDTVETNTKTKTKTNTNTSTRTHTKKRSLSADTGDTEEDQTQGGRHKRSRRIPRHNAGVPR